MQQTVQRSHLQDELNNEFWRHVLSDIEQHFNAPDVQVLHNGRNKIKRLDIQESDSIEAVPVVVKHFRNNTFGKKLAYKLRSSKALRSFEHSQRLADAGILVPRPLAWREDWSGAWLHQSFFISEYHDFSFTAWDLKKNAVPDNELHIRMLGTDVGRMHNAQINHQDLTPGNALFKRSEEGALLQLFFIDCNRMSFGQLSKEAGLRALVRMGLEGEHIDPYVDAYAQERGFDSAQCIKRYRQLLARHKFKWKIKNKTRPWRRKIGL